MPLPRRPILGITCLLIVGSGVGLKVGVGVPVAILLSLAATVCAATVYGWRRGAVSGLAAMAAAVGCAGFLSGTDAARTRQRELAWLQAHAAEPVYVRGVVDRSVERNLPGVRQARPTVALRRVVIEHAHGVYPLAQVTALVTWYGGERLPQTGETWAFRTRLPRVRARARHPCLPVNTRPDDAVRLAAAAFWDWRPLADRARQSAARRLSLGIASWPVVPVLIQAMLLGTRNAIPQEMNAVFRNSGTIHVFAISGLGVGLVAAVLAAGLALAAVPRPRWGWALIPLLVAYTLLTGASPSAMRACLMASFYFGAPLLGRKPDACAALAAAALLQIAWEPRDLFNLSFLLSYTVMAGLILLCPPFSRLFRKVLRVDHAATQAALLRLSQRLAARQRPFARQAWAVRTAVWRYTARLYLADTLAMGVAAWIASVPLTAFYFGRFIPGGLLANLVVVPASLLITIAGSLAILASLLSEVAAEVFNHAAAACTALMVEASRLTVCIPGASIPVAAPPVALVAAWYVAMLILAWRLRASSPAEDPYASVSGSPAGGTP